MAFKMPGLLKSPAFQAGFVRNINTRFDKMAENAEKYKLAAMSRGQELFKEYKATETKLKVENEAKQYIAQQFSPELADFMDSGNQLNYLTGMDAKDFLEQADSQAKKIMQGGGVPEDFTANENPYYGEQRFEKLDKTYGKVKDFMNKNNNVFGDSFELLFETNTPEMMSKEEFGVRAREDITSLGRTGLGATEIDANVEIKLNKQIAEFGGFESMITKIGPEGQTTYEFENPNEQQVANIAKRIANTHYRFNPNRATDGIGGSANFGVMISRNIIAKASSNDTLESAMNDLANIRDTMYTIPGIGNSAAELDSTMNSSISLYLYMLGQRTTDPNLVQDIKTEIQKRTGEEFVSSIGSISTPFAPNL